jgi:hypothetical protein
LANGASGSVQLCSDYGTGEVTICGSDEIRKALDARMAPVEGLEELPTVEMDDMVDELQWIIDNGVDQEN